MPRAFAPTHLPALEANSHAQDLCSQPALEGTLPRFKAVIDKLAAVAGAGGGGEEGGVLHGGEDGGGGEKGLGITRASMKAVRQVCGV